MQLVYRVQYTNVMRYRRFALSVDRAVPLVDRSFTQPSFDRAARSMVALSTENNHADWRASVYSAAVLNELLVNVIGQ